MQRLVLSDTTPLGYVERPATRLNTRAKTPRIRGRKAVFVVLYERGEERYVAEELVSIHKLESNALKRMRQLEEQEKLELGSCITEYRIKSIGLED